MTKNNYFITLRKTSGPDTGNSCEIPAVLAAEQHKQGNSIKGDPGYRIYLLFPGELLPAAGDIISDCGMEFEITEIKFCRDVSGKIRAVRCTTLN
jgi:hypothetical protein